MENKCVCCGAVIPEGRQVCPPCKRAEQAEKAFLQARAENKSLRQQQEATTLEQLVEKVCGSCGWDEGCPFADNCWRGHNGFADWLRKAVKK